MSDLTPVRDDATAELVCAGPVQSLGTYDAAVEKAKKNGYDEIHKFYKAAYARYQKALAA